MKAQDTTRGTIVYDDKIRVEIMKVDKEIPDIVWQEGTALILGDKDSLMRMKGGENDAGLADEYLELYSQIDKIRDKLIATNYKFSRNLVACNPKCCYSWIQKLDNKLIVVARSTDMSKGYKGDKQIFKIIADFLACDKIEIVGLHQHYYLKNLLGDDSVARRK